MKRINFLIIVILAFLLCSANRCENQNCHKTIAFVNKSSKDVYMYYSGYGNYGIPDSTFFLPYYLSSSDKNYFHPYDKIESNKEKSRAVENGDCLENWIKETKGRLNIFVLDAEIYETVPRDTILKYRMVKTITPTLDEMQANNWTITYTGE